nr:hypothetical protein [Tabrizicola sp.]
DDLVAQQGVNVATQAMNEATQSMNRASWVSVWLVGGGTLLLVWSLALTRQANAAAREAVRITRDLGQIQMRSSVYVASARFKVTPNGLYVYFGLKNAGTSHATYVKGTVQGTLMVKKADSSMPGLDIFDLDAMPFEIGVIVTGETSTPDSTFWADVRSNELFRKIFTHPEVTRLDIAVCAVNLECKDVFGGNHHLVAQISCQQFERSTSIGGIAGQPAERPIFRGSGTIKHLDFRYEEPAKT